MTARTPRNTALILLVLALWGPAYANAAPADAGGYKGPAPCKVAGANDDTPVDKACREGGIKAAKALMKQLQKDGKKADIRHQCEDCHTDEADHSKLTKDARDKLAKLLAATRK
jgi:hypothetical protein